MKNNKIKLKTQTTNLEKYGSVCSLNDPEIKQKAKDTLKKNYNVDNPFESEKIKDKIYDTNTKKYGVKIPTQNPEIYKKVKDTNLIKYGFECSAQNAEVREKAKQTNLERYGVEYPVQNPDVYEKISKNSFLSKDYKLPSGKIIKIQGYEHFALDEMLEIYDEDDIIHDKKNVPEIWYNDENKKTRRHYVDFYIKSEDKCIEIKSTYTYKKEERDVLAKQKAGKTKDREYEIWIYNEKGICTSVLT